MVWEALPAEMWLVPKRRFQFGTLPRSSLKFHPDHRCSSKYRFLNIVGIIELICLGLMYGSVDAFEQARSIITRGRSCLP